MTRDYKELRVVALLCLALGGCVQKWEKPGAGAYEFEAMQAACGSRAYQRFPPRVREELVEPGRRTPVQQLCVPAIAGGAPLCSVTGGQYVPPLYTTVDYNRGARDQEVRACYFENGWRPARR